MENDGNKGATIGLEETIWIPDTSSHSWQAIISTKKEIGKQGMMIATKTTAFTAIVLFTNPELIKKVATSINRCLVEDYPH